MDLHPWGRSSPRRAFHDVTRTRGVEIDGAHYAYWLAVDMLRLAYYSGEVTDLPFGATYVARDGSNERWVYRPGGWER